MSMEPWDLPLAIGIFITMGVCTYLLGLWRGRGDIAHLRHEVVDATRRADQAEAVIATLAQHTSDPADLARLMADHTERILDGMTDVARALTPDYTTTVTIPDDTDDTDGDVDGFEAGFDPRGDFDDWSDIAATTPGVSAAERMARGVGVEPPVDPDLGWDAP